MAAHEHNHVQHALLPLAAVGSTLAVTFSPYILPLIGIGKSATATESMLALHGSGAGTGLAGAASEFMGQIPGIGGTLAAGGMGSMLLTGAVGIGGVLFANWLEKRETGEEPIRWSKIIRTVAITTSILMALPAILTGISVGITFLAATFGGIAAAGTAVSFLAPTLGTAGAFSATTLGAGLTAAALPHLLTCTAAIAPALGAILLGNNKEKAEAPSRPNWQERLNQQLATVHAQAR